MARKKPTKKKTTPLACLHDETMFLFLLLFPPLLEWYVNNENTNDMLQAFKRMFIAFYDLSPLIITVVAIIIFIGIVVSYIESR